MKKIVALIMILALLLTAAGCAVQQQAAQGMQQEEPAQTQLAEKETAVQPAPAPQPKTPSQETAEPEESETTASDSGYNFEALSKDQQRKIKLVRNLLAEARNREENYFYRYTAPGVAQTDVWVKGAILKRSIYRADELDKFKTYNMVYLDRNAMTAKGYCETTKSKCWQGKGPFAESYSKWLLKTPKDWAVELGDDFYWALDNKVADQLYHIIDYKKDGKTIRVYVNDYRGIPYRVEIYNRVAPLDSIITGAADQVYLYNDMNIGGVSDDDVTLPV